MFSIFVFILHNFNLLNLAEYLIVKCSWILNICGLHIVKQNGSYIPVWFQHKFEATTYTRMYMFGFVTASLAVHWLADCMAHVASCFSANKTLTESLMMEFWQTVKVAVWLVWGAIIYWNAKQVIKRGPSESLQISVCCNSCHTCWKFCT